MKMTLMVKDKLRLKKFGNGDHNKDLLCEQKGFKLYRIKELDWQNDNINIRNFIKQIIEVN